MAHIKWSGLRRENLSLRDECHQERERSARANERIAFYTHALASKNRKIVELRAEIRHLHVQLDELNDSSSESISSLGSDVDSSSYTMTFDSESESENTTDARSESQIIYVSARSSDDGLPW